MSTNNVYYDGSSGHSDVNMGLGLDNEVVEEIQYKYNPSLFEGVQPDPSFVNQGEETWQRRRAAWIANSASTTEGQYDDNFSIDVEHVMVSLQAYKPFPEPIALPAMVEILNVLWEEEAV